MAIYPEQLKAVIQAVVANTLTDVAAKNELAQNEMRPKIQELASQLAATQVAPTSAVAPAIRAYEPIDITSSVPCNMTLDAVKYLPEFSGSQESYVSWRQAAVAAYRIFKDYNGTSRHYEAVTIIRNKIRGAANNVLSSFGTVLNFDVIINRLDYTYSDKRPMHVIEQDMSTLRQGSNMTLLEYYDEVEKKLTLLTNKVHMSHEPSVANILCEKFREDALRIFISGLKRNLTDVLFAAKPKDMPSALALPEEVESNHERYVFAASFARSQEDKDRKPTAKAQGRQLDKYDRHDPQPSNTKNP